MNFRYCLVMMFIYVSCNTIYIAALIFVPNAITSAIMSLDPAIVFVFSFIFLNNLKLGILKNVQQCISAILAVCGVCCIVLGASENEENEKEDSVENEFVGIILACIAALLAGMYKILYRYFFGKLDLGQCCYSLGIIGLLAFLGLCFNFCVNFGVSITYPLFISIGGVLVAPSNLLVDMLIREYEFSTLQIVGSVISVLALIILILPIPKLKKNEEKEEMTSL